MTVTELAIFKGLAETASPGLWVALNAALANQTRWLRLDPAATGANPLTGGRAWLLQQIEDPGVVLLAAAWASLDEHEAWRTTDPDSDAILGGILQNLYKPKDAGDPQQPFELLHTDGDIVTGPLEPGVMGLLDSPVISLTRMVVQAGQKDAFDKAFRENRADLDRFAAPRVLRAQWRVDKEKDEAAGVDKEEMVLMGGWESVAAHRAFAESPYKDKAAAYGNLVAYRDTKHYRLIL